VFSPWQQENYLEAGGKPGGKRGKIPLLTCLVSWPCVKTAEQANVAETANFSRPSILFP